MGIDLLPRLAHPMDQQIDESKPNCKLSYLSFECGMSISVLVYIIFCSFFCVIRLSFISFLLFLTALNEASSCLARGSPDSLDPLFWLAC
ncbi:hypothetical protein Leryth_027625, partial [Lithospermum erythrorhizon]